ncbi:MAG: hypothetical protein KDB56_18050 [Mycobacterium sp.]|nr:hypothetical protein [Mycobacterium sp.]
MSTWGTGLEGQRLPGHRVVITEQTRRGRSNRHTFVIGHDGQWATEPDLPKLLERTAAAGYGRPGRPADLARAGMLRRPLPATVTLSTGATVSAGALTVILDALAGDGRHRVDVADVKRVVSQLGPRLAALADLPDGDTRHAAERAVHQQILSRCTSV